MVIPAIAPHRASVAFSGTSNKKAIASEKAVVKPSLVKRAVKSVGIASVGVLSFLATSCQKPDINPDPPIKQDTTIIKPPVVTTKSKVISMMDSLGIMPKLKSTKSTAVLPKEVDYYQPYVGGNVKDEFLATSTDDTIRIKKSFSANGQDLGADNLKVYLKGDTVVSEATDAATNKLREVDKFFFKDGGVMQTMSNTKSSAYKYLPKDQVSLTMQHIDLRNNMKVISENTLKLLKVVF